MISTPTLRRRRTRRPRSRRAWRASLAPPSPHKCGLVNESRGDARRGAGTRSKRPARAEAARAAHCRFSSRVACLDAPLRASPARLRPVGTLSRRGTRWRCGAIILVYYDVCVVVAISFFDIPKPLGPAGSGRAVRGRGGRACERAIEPVWVRCVEPVPRAGPQRSWPWSGPPWQSFRPAAPRRTPTGVAPGSVATGGPAH